MTSLNFKSDSVWFLSNGTRRKQVNIKFDAKLHRKLDDAN